MAETPAADELVEEAPEPEEPPVTELPTDTTGKFLFTREYAVRTGNDDAFVNATRVNLVDHALYLHGAIGSTPYTNYVRFADVQLPEDAVVTGAYIDFTAYAASSATQSAEFTISGELGEGAAFTSEWPALPTVRLPSLLRRLPPPKWRCATFSAPVTLSTS